MQSVTILSASSVHIKSYLTLLLKDCIQRQLISFSFSTSKYHRPTMTTTVHLDNIAYHRRLLHKVTANGLVLGGGNRGREEARERRREGGNKRSLHITSLRYLNIDSSTDCIPTDQINNHTILWHVLISSLLYPGRNRGREKKHLWLIIISTTYRERERWKWRRVLYTIHLYSQITFMKTRC